MSDLPVKPAMEFPTEEAYKTYFHEHPKADPKNHSVKKTAPQPKAIPGGTTVALGITDADIDRSLAQHTPIFKAIQTKMKGIYDTFVTDPRNAKLKAALAHLPEAEQMIAIAGQEVGAYFEDGVVQNEELHAKVTRQWRKSSDTDTALQLSGALHDMGVKGSMRSSEKSLMAIRERGEKNKAMHEYVKELVTFHQAFFKFAGIKELTAYRGIRRQIDKLDKGAEVQLNCREASSFTLDPRVAKDFGRVVEYKVPVDTVLISPITSPNFGSKNAKDWIEKQDKYLGESELILMGASLLKGKVWS